MAKGYRPVRRDQPFLLPPDMREWLPADHPVWLVIKAVGEHLDTSAFHAVRRHLEPGGLFLFDVWNGPAVLAQRPKERTLAVESGDARIQRKSEARLDEEKGLIHVRFDIEHTRDGARDLWAEEHMVRYFFPSELRSKLSASDLRLLDLRSFPDGEQPPDEHAWNVIGVARAE